MANRKTVLIAIILITLSAGLIAAGIGRKPMNICTDLNCFKFASAWNFRKTETYTDTSDAYRALFTSDTTLLRVEVRKILSGELQAEEDAQVARVKALFEKAPAPYPGDISDAIVCDADFVPVYREHTNSGTRIRYFEGYLNDRQTFGSCSGSEAQYRGVLAYFSCPNTPSIVRVELFAPTAHYTGNEASFLSAIRSLDCTGN